MSSDAAGDSLEIRQATTADRPALEAFVAATYGAAASFKSRRRRDWQFLANPYRPQEGDRLPIWIAVNPSSGRIAGQIAVQDGRAVLRGEPVPAGWIVDVMVDPDYRGLGLGHRIHAAVMRDRTCLVTLTMAPATRRIADRAGALTLGPTYRLIRPVRIRGATVRRFAADRAQTRPRLRGPVRAFNASRIGPALLGAGLSGWAAQRRSRRPEPETAAGIEEVVRFGSEADALWERIAPRFQAIFERTSRFLDWRFEAGAPDLAYRRFVLRGPDGIRGYSVLRSPRPEELPGGIIADLIADPQDRAGLDALLAHACLTLGPACEYLEAAASAPAFLAAYQRAGFVRWKTMHPTVVATDPALAARIEALPNAWHFSKADHDWDQVNPVAPV